MSINKKQIVIIDIETSSLHASGGFVVGFGLMDENEVFTHRFLNGKGIDDGEKTLLTQFQADVSNYGLVVGHNIRRFDIPMAVSRCLIHGLDPRPLLRLNIVDTLEIAHNYLLLQYNTLEDLCRFFKIPKNTCLRGEEMPVLFMRAIQDKTALIPIIEHCKDNKLKILIDERTIRY